MSNNVNFDEYENLFSNLNGADTQQQQRNRTHQYLQQQQQQQQYLPTQQNHTLSQSQPHDGHQHQIPLQYPQNQNSQPYPEQQQQPIDSGNFDSSVFAPSHNQQTHTGSRSRFGSFASNSSSQFGSEVNFNELNDAVSSLNSGILSPYSTGSSPDGFFLSATTSNVDSQYSQDPTDYPDLNTNTNINNDILYPNQLVPVPMAESASNSTVTFNTNDNYHAQQMIQTLNTVDEGDEYSVKKETPQSPEDAQNSLHRVKSCESSQSKLGRKVKSSHNLIEKKYRTNINSKIIELRNCVPALRILVAKNGNHRTRSTGNEVEETDDYYEGNGYSDDEEKLDGLKPAKKLNKATILSKASEYIRHLEKKNDILKDQNYKLRKLLESTGSGMNNDFFIQQQQQQQFYQQQQQQQSRSLHSSPFTKSNSNSNSTSNGSNLVSPIDQNYQNQQLPDHQALTTKMMMGSIGQMLGVTNLDDFPQGHRS